MSIIKFINRRKTGQSSQEWMIIYSDLMTNLMLFFLMLFALTRLSLEDKSKVYQSLKKDFTTIQEKSKFHEVLKIEKQAEDEITAMASQFEEMGNLLKVNINEQYIKLRLPSPILFDSGNTELKNEGKQVLTQIAEIVHSMPHEIVVEGHTDATPVTRSRRYISNWELSGMRALAALQHLIKKDISPKRLSAVAYGQLHPLFPNDTEDNRRKNRRIEINIVKEQQL